MYDYDDKINTMYFICKMEDRLGELDKYREAGKIRELGKTRKVGKTQEMGTHHPMDHTDHAETSRDYNRDDDT
jgi:hypothetical protein